MGPHLAANVCSVNVALAEEQLSAIDELVTVARELGVSVWLRGGWAVDFFLGRVTRDHADVDWFALTGEGQQLADRLIGSGYEDVTSTPPGQQIDLVRGTVDHGIALVRLGSRNEPLVAGGPWAAEPWPDGMLDGPECRIGNVRTRIIAPLVQIEIKQMTPTWHPKLQRRQKDLDDIAAIRSRLDGSRA